jgi:hypothetical protein
MSAKMKRRDFIMSAAPRRRGSSRLNAGLASPNTLRQGRARVIQDSRRLKKHAEP